MTTPVTAHSTAPTSTSPTTSETTTKAATTTSTSSSVEETITNLAQSLMGFADRSSPDRARNQRMFNRVERLVDSIVRLVETLATYRAGANAERPEHVGSLPSPREESQPAMPPSLRPDTPDTGGTCGGCCPPSPNPNSQVGAEKPPSQSSSTLHLGSKLPATRGFLWKPVSDKNGNLAVLLPKQYTGAIKRVRILNPQGTKVLATGTFSGVGNGDREHFRFTKPGTGFPDGAIVLIEMENGSARHVKIKDTAKRTEQ